MGLFLGISVPQVQHKSKPLASIHVTNSLFLLFLSSPSELCHLSHIGTRPVISRIKFFSISPLLHLWKLGSRSWSINRKPGKHTHLGISKPVSLISFLVGCFSVACQPAVRTSAHGALIDPPQVRCRKRDKWLKNPLEPTQTAHF